MPKDCSPQRTLALDIMSATHKDRPERNRKVCLLPGIHCPRKEIIHRILAIRMGTSFLEINEDEVSEETHMYTLVKHKTAGSFVETLCLAQGQLQWEVFQFLWRTKMSKARWHQLIEEIVFYANLWSIFIRFINAIIFSRTEFSHFIFNMGL